VNDRIKLWDAATGLPRASLGAGHDRFIGTIAFSPDGRIRLVHDARTVQFWDVATGWQQKALRVESDASSGAVFHYGRFLAMGGADGTVRVWDLAPMAREE
jgi:WD40 repeat protein